MNLQRLCGLRNAALTTMALTTIFTGFLPTSSDAAIWYLQADNAYDQNYNMANLWFSAPTGGVAATSINSGDTYTTNGKTVRTGIDGVVSTFAGILNVSGGGNMVLKGPTATVANISIDATGGTISHGTVNTSLLTGTNMAVNGALTLLTNNNARTISLNYATLQGAGNMTLTGTGANYGGVTLAFGNASGYSGTIFSTSGTYLDFASSFATGGGLSIATGTQVLGFDDAVSFNSVSIAGTALTVGTTYSYATLKASYGAIFTGTGVGSITVVPEPSTWMLLGAAGFVFVLVRARNLVRRRHAMMGA